MKNKMGYVLIVGLFSMLTIHAQKFQAQASYEIQDLLRPELQQKYKLTFDAMTSVYQDEAANNNTGIYYKNSDTQLFVTSKKANKNDYLICDALEKFNWNITSETKTILGYSCTKATSASGALVVWFTPGIPTNQGPENYTGLPGLILEVSSEKKVISCAKINLLPPGKVQIKPPVNGIKVNQKQFDTLSKKK